MTVDETLLIAVMRPYGLQYNAWSLLAGPAKVREAVDRLLEQVRLKKRGATIAGEMSYSEQRSLEIAMTLASDPKVRLLF